MVKPFFGNADTQVLHKSKKKDACRAAEIAIKNRKKFASVEEAEQQGYRTCKICFK